MTQHGIIDMILTFIFCEWLFDIYILETYDYIIYTFMLEILKIVLLIEMMRKSVWNLLITHRLIEEKLFFEECISS